MLISIPLGVGAGIYMAEFAPANRLTDIIRTATETLASLPSIIVGLFGLLLFVQRLHMGFSVLAGALALTVFNLPIIERVAETSLRALPSGLREGSLALGMTRWQTIRTVLLPSALPGLVTGFILTAGRIFGEAAALLFTSGQSSSSLNWHDISLFSDTSPIGLFRPAETLAVHIWKLNSEGLVPDYRHIADGAAALLILFVLAFNVIARFLGRWLHRRITATH
jgi:phosphate transport system permease protein